MTTARATRGERTGVAFAAEAIDGTAEARNDNDPLGDVFMLCRRQFLQLAAGAAATVQFNTAGVFNYTCSPHPWMIGQVTVV